jgi:hypothetical protein
VRRHASDDMEEEEEEKEIKEANVQCCAEDEAVVF